jgi:hypothetical protein
MESRQKYNRQFLTDKIYEETNTFLLGKLTMKLFEYKL